MRIGILVNGRSHEGGVTTYINTIVDPLRSLGHQVDVITAFGISPYRPIRSSFTSGTDKALKNRPWMTWAAYQVSRILLGWHLIRGCFAGRRLEGENKGIYRVVISIDASSAIVANFLRRFIPFKVVERVGGLLAKDLVVQGKIPEDSLLHRYFRSQERKAYAGSNIVVPISSWMQNYVKSMAPTSNVAPPMINGVNPSVFYADKENTGELRAEMDLEDVFVVFFPSRLEHRKGVMVALMALEILLKDGENVALLFAGRGPAEDDIRDYIREKKLEAFVRLTGPVPKEKMRELYNLADVAIVPSITTAGWEEPLANCPLEAMACGTPVIASRMGGLVDSVIEGETGLLVSENSPPDLAAGIAQVIKSKELRDRLTEGAFRLTSSRCSAIASARHLNDIVAGVQTL